MWVEELSIIMKVLEWRLKEGDNKDGKGMESSGEMEGKK